MKAAGGRTRLTPRGERLVTTLACLGIALSLVAGFTADTWNPWAKATTVAVAP